MNQPIFITGVERSGSSIVAKIFDMSGAFTGKVSTMYENTQINALMYSFLYSRRNGLFPDLKNLRIPLDWNTRVSKIICEQGYTDGPWMIKSAKLTQMWPVWNYAFPNARWIIVRRRTGDIIESCTKTGYMKLFKSKSRQKLVGVDSEVEGWKWWVHQYERRFVNMIESGVNCRIVWPERMVTGDYQQMYETLEWLGLKWNSNILATIDPMLNKSRRKLQWH